MLRTAMNPLQKGLQLIGKVPVTLGAAKSARALKFGVTQPAAGAYGGVLLHLLAAAEHGEHGAQKALNIAAYKAELHFFHAFGAKPPRGDLAAGGNGDGYRRLILAAFLTKHECPSFGLLILALSGNLQ